MDNLIFGLSTTAVGMLVVFAGLVILIACISIMGLLNKNTGTKKKAVSAPKATTPTLFIQADEDYRCWMSDAIQMYTALKLACLSFSVSSL